MRERHDDDDDDDGGGDGGSCCEEAEDFMRNEVIVAAEMGLEAKRSRIAISTTKLRVAIEVLANALLPTATTLYYAYMRNQKSVVENVRKLLLPTVLAVLANCLSQSLSSVQKRISTTPPPPPPPPPRLVDDDDDAPEPSVECSVLTHPAAVRADVIFVHGLHGALHKTWRRGAWRHERHKINRLALTKSPSTRNLKRPGAHRDACVALTKISKTALGQTIDDERRAARNDASSCWPLWLANDYPGSRVIAVNYTTDPYLWRPIWVKKRNRTGMVDRSREMIEKLRAIGVGAHPIVWVGHSKGGLFIKQILVDCADNREDRAIYEQSKAILFYSVPHRGSIMADISLPLLSRSIEVAEVQKNCKFVLELHEKFLQLFEDEAFRPEVFSFIESSFTLMSFIYLRIVTIESADPGVGEICEVPLDHREICKPAGRDCFLYKELVQLMETALGKDDLVAGGPQL